MNIDSEMLSAKGKADLEQLVAQEGSEEDREFDPTMDKESLLGRLPPIPVEVLGAAKGRLYTPEELARHFSQAVFPRTTNRYGCVTLHSYHFYIEAGLPQT